MAAMLKRKLSTLQTYLGGIKYMTGLPDIVIIVDQQEEYTALRECAILGFRRFVLIDTNLSAIWLYDISGVEVGQHFYWQIGGLQIHAQVLITSWVVIAILCALLPWKIIQLPHGELAAPTNDIKYYCCFSLTHGAERFYGNGGSIRCLSNEKLEHRYGLSKSMEGGLRETITTIIITCMIPSSWTNHINSCINSLSSFEVSINSSISGGTDNYIQIESNFRLIRALGILWIEDMVSMDPIQFHSEEDLIKIVSILIKERQFMGGSMGSVVVPDGSQAADSMVFPLNQNSKIKV
uniref:Uncharacterized protein n=1 Tax=Ananas comosus var. bracteatus TaxID=296719 RepID=A0A6V7PVX4_ANACO|nr:unnamed protein product [Ananas comosus var. bracteatus]